MHTTPSITAALLALCLIAPSFAASAPPTNEDQPQWASYRGPSATGVAKAHLPTTWNVETGENVRWSIEIPGLAHSSPVVWGDRVFVTTAVRIEGEAKLRVGLYGDIAPVNDEGEIAFRVLCFRLSDGELLWDKLAYQGVPKIKRHTKASHANSSPSTDGTTVIAMFASEGLYAYDFDGNLKWKKDFGVLDTGYHVVKSAQWGFASSPVIHRDRVIVQADVQGQSFLTALNVDTGAEIWRTDREEVPTWSTPTIAPRPTGDQPGQEGTEQILINGWKHTGGYDFTTGKELWRIEGGGDIPVPTPIIAGHLALLTSAHGPSRPIRAIHLSATGDIQGTEAIAWEHEKAGNYMQTPIVVNGVAYFCYDNGVLSAYDAATGERLFQHRLGGGKSGFSGSPVSDGQHVFFGSEDGDVYVIKAAREFQEVALNELGETFMSTPAIASNTILFRARKHLIAIGKTVGE